MGHANDQPFAFGGPSMPAPPHWMLEAQYRAATQPIMFVPAPGPTLTPAEQAAAQAAHRARMDRLAADVEHRIRYTLGELRRAGIKPAVHESNECLRGFEPSRWLKRPTYTTTTVRSHVEYYPHGEQTSESVVVKRTRSDVGVCKLDHGDFDVSFQLSNVGAYDVALKLDRFARQQGLTLQPWTAYEEALGTPPY